MTLAFFRECDVQSVSPAIQDIVDLVDVVSNYCLAKVQFRMTQSATIPD